MRLIRDSIDHLFDYNMHVETRTLYLGDSEEGVNRETSEKFLKGMHLLLAQSTDKPIRVILNTMGGCWFNGMSIYDAIRAAPCHVSVEATGSVMSMGSVIIQAGDERLIRPHATFMIHDGYEGGSFPTKSFEAWGKYSAVTRKTMYEIYAEKSQKPVTYWEKRCAADFILTAEQALELGLVDKILKPPKVKT